MWYIISVIGNIVLLIIVILLVRAWLKFHRWLSHELDQMIDSAKKVVDK